MENNNEQQPEILEDNSLEIYMEPSNVGEAMEDYLRKYDVIGPLSSIDKIVMPLGVDEAGLVPIIVSLHKNNNKMN